MIELGFKVICMDASPCTTCGAIGDLIKGAIYVVEGVRFTNCGQTIYDLVGLRPTCHGLETGYLQRRFKTLHQAKVEAMRDAYLEATGFLHPDIESPKYLRPQDFKCPEVEDDDEP